MTPVLARARWVAVTAGVALCGWLEWHAAVGAGIHPWIAACYPILVDTYIATAMLSGRDVPAALAVMWMSVVVGVTVVTLDLAALPWPRAAVAVWLGTAVAVVLWRVHTAVHADLRDAAERARVEAAERARMEARERARVSGSEGTRTGTEPVTKPAARARRAPTKRPVRDRDTVYAAWLRDGLDVPQVAAELGITPRAARAQIRRWQDRTTRQLEEALT